MSADFPTIFVGLCDDAAVFPPGNLPLADAVPAHARHETSAHAPLVGALVVAANDLDKLAEIAADLEPGSLRLALTVPLPQLAVALASVERIAAVRLESVEASLPDDTVAATVVSAVEQALASRPIDVFVELPRDARRPEVIESLSGTGFMAKLRAGGVRADLYPDEKELAAALISLTAARVPFKATAGLHHALSNTDPVTQFEQHGFLNLLAATGAALSAATVVEIAAVLADRDAESVVECVRTLSPEVRNAFRSFGTCSIAEPVEELAGLGLLDPQLTKDLA